MQINGKEARGVTLVMSNDEKGVVTYGRRGNASYVSMQ